MPIFYMQYIIVVSNGLEWIVKQIGSNFDILVWFIVFALPSIKNPDSRISKILQKPVHDVHKSVPWPGNENAGKKYLYNILGHWAKSVLE